MTEKTKKKIRKASLGVISVLFSVIVALPFIWMFICSMYGTSEEVFSTKLHLPDGLHFENYANIINDMKFFMLLKNTMTILLFNVFVGILSSVIIAYGFARYEAKGKNFCFSLMLSTMMLPWVVTMVPAYMLWNDLGLVGTKWPLMLPSIGGGAFNVFLLMQFFRGIPRELDEAATLDGCSKIMILFRMLLPNSLPVLVTLTVFSFNGQWSDYIGPSLYIMDTEQYTISLGLLQAKNNMTTAPRWNEIMAGCVVFSIPSIIIYALSQKAFVGGIVMTGIKG